MKYYLYLLFTTTQCSSISVWDKYCVIETLEFFRVLYAEDKVWYGSYQAPALTGTPANVTWETRDGNTLSNSDSTGEKSLHSLPTLAKISANAATPLLLSTKSYCVMIRLHKPSPPRVTAVSQCAGRSFMVMGRSFLMVINLQISISPFFSPNYCPIYEMFYAITCGFLW